MKGMHNRYFIGLTLPDELSKQIHDLQNRFHEPSKTMQPLVPHITLLPPNLLMSVSPMYLLPKLRGIEDSFLPLTVELTSINAFGERVLYIAVENPGLERIHDEMLKLLPEKVQKSYAPQHSFTPHITLLQAKPKQTLPSEATNEFKKQLAPLLPTTFDADQLYIFKWIKPRTYAIKPVGKH